jgi:Nickel/cobalt transporter regulator
MKYFVTAALAVALASLAAASAQADPPPNNHPHPARTPPAHGAPPPGGSHASGGNHTLPLIHGTPSVGPVTPQIFHGAGPGGGPHTAGGPPVVGPGGSHSGHGFHSHALRPADQGRSYYSASAVVRAFTAPRRFHFFGGGYPTGWYARSWAYGDILPFGWFTPDYYLDFSYYGLPMPPVGCEWVREGPDAVLVDIWTGEVLSVYSGLFY